MNKYTLASKLVSGVLIAIVVNKLTPHVEEVLDTAVEKAKNLKHEETK